MENIKQTIRVFGEDRTAYTLREVETLIELRDKIHLKDKMKLNAVIAFLIGVLSLCLFTILMLW